MEQTTFRRILNTGLTGHDPRQAEQGYAVLPMNDLNQTLIIDMVGEVVHRWQHGETSASMARSMRAGTSIWGQR